MTRSRAAVLSLASQTIPLLAFVWPSPWWWLTTIVPLANAYQASRGDTVSKRSGFFWLFFSVVIFARVLWPLCFLVPVLVYLALPLADGKGKPPWLRAGELNKPTKLLLVATIIVTTIALESWVLLYQPDLSDIMKLIPPASLGVMILGALAFSILNALWEEFLFKGILWEGLEQWLPKGLAINLWQTILFGLIHYHGLPRGLSGVWMSALYGFVMGVLRQLSGGMLAPVLAHVFADLAICGLYFWWVTK